MEKEKTDLIENNQSNQIIEEKGSALSDEEKELKKYDNWHCQNKKNAEYREGALHGAVGKEISDALKLDRKNSDPQEDLK